MKRMRSSALVLMAPASPTTKYESPSLEPEPAPDEMKGVLMSRADRREPFAQLFRDDAIAAVEELAQDVLRRRVDADDAVSVLLPYLIKASPAQRNLVFNALMDFATSRDILFGALTASERDPDQRVLRVAAELLEHYGAEAAPVLVRLARSERPECRYFVGAIMNTPGIPEGLKREALTALGRHPDAGTRQELLDEAERASDSDAAFLFRLLALDSDSRIRKTATERLAELEP